MLRVVGRLLDRQNRLEERLRSMQKALPGPEGERLTAQVVREEEIREALRDVFDPEVGIDIVDLGLIKEIIIRGDDSVEVDMVLTAQACPMRSHLTVLDEPWNWDHFIRSQKARV
jgi:serine O-acetyltransferase